MGRQNPEASEAHFEFDGGTAQGLDGKHEYWKLDGRKWIGWVIFFFKKVLCLSNFGRIQNLWGLWRWNKFCLPKNGTIFYELGPGFFKKIWKYYEIPVAVVSKLKVFCYFGSFFVGRLRGGFAFANPDFPCHPGELADQPIKARVGGRLACVSSSPIPGARKVTGWADWWWVTCHMSDQWQRKKMEILDIFGLCKVFISLNRFWWYAPRFFCLW